MVFGLLFSQKRQWRTDDCNDKKKIKVTAGFRLSCRKEIDNIFHKRHSVVVDVDVRVTYFCNVNSQALGLGICSRDGWPLDNLCFMWYVLLYPQCYLHLIYVYMYNIYNIYNNMQAYFALLLNTSHTYFPGCGNIIELLPSRRRDFHSSLHSVALNRSDKNK